MDIETVNNKIENIIKEVKKYKNNIRIISYNKELEFDDPNKITCVCDTCNSSFNFPYKMYWMKSCPICGGNGLSSVQKQDVNELKASKIKKETKEMTKNITRRTVSKELNDYIKIITNNIQNH